jgi:methyl-accepting chemotaxis protein
MTKLMLTFGLLAAFTGFVGYEGLSSMGEIEDNLNEIYTHAHGLEDLLEANVQLLKRSRAVRNAILDDNDADIDKRIADSRRYEESFVKHLGEYEKSQVSGETRAKAAEILKQFTALVPRQNEVMAHARAHKDQEARAGLKTIRVMADEIEKGLDELVASKLKLMETADKDAEAAYRSSRFVVVAVVILVVGLALGIGVVIARMIARPLGEASDVLQTVAAGDFTQTLDIDTKDEVGTMATALNAAVRAMRTALHEVSLAAAHAASASQQLSAASEQLSSGAQEQASSLEETAASLEEITGTVKQNADNARQASQLAVGSRDVAEQGGRVVTDAVHSMGEINKASKKIADIITTIDEIAFQTNLLALNAAVEAARAGEQGRGFAVVASEVRNLAQRSATAAKEIKDLINDSVQKVEAGSELVNKSGETLNEIVGSVKRVTDIIAEIAAASQEQTSGIDQVNKAVTQMDQVTQSNAAQTEELSSTAQALAAQAEQLHALVARFKIGDDRGTDARLAVPAPTAPRSVPAPTSKVDRGSLTKPASTVSAAAQLVPVRPAMVTAGASNGHGTNGHATPPKHDGFEEF